MALIEEITSASQKKYDEAIRDLELVSELSSVQEKTSRLFSPDHPIDKETTELFRAMCILSQCGSKVRPVTSHRPFIGRYIVFFKKLAWKVIEPQLKHILDGVSDCFSCLIVSHAKLIQRINTLETKHEVEK
jgi:hypothetical protein